MYICKLVANIFVQIFEKRYDLHFMVRLLSSGVIVTTVGNRFYDPLGEVRTQALSGALFLKQPS